MWTEIFISWDECRKGNNIMTYDLSRFHKAQEHSYETALAEIRSGYKQSHWIWYIFPQIAGLGYSSTARYYALSSLDEARVYMADPVLSGRLKEISEALLGLKSSDPEEIMGWPDNLKLRSSMTLFREVSPETEVFQKVLDKYFEGKPDTRTLEIISS